MSNNMPLVLVILDGFGWSEDPHYNAILKAQTPHWDDWWKTMPHMLLNASGEAVGLPEGQMGNSEVGHMHIGAGRVIYQDYTRINQAIAHQEFEHSPILIQALDTLKKTKRPLHVMGLLSPGGVHSHEAHLFAFLKMCSQLNFHQVILHLFLDGRDTPPKSALISIEKLNRVLEDYPCGRISSISGRYYAMDRDKRLERTLLTYELLTEGKTPYQFHTAEQAINAFYAQGIEDEFIPPTQIGSFTPINDGDGIFFFNFRADRARQLTQALLLGQNEPYFSPPPKLSCFISMTQYAGTLPTEVVFPPISLNNTLGEVLAQHHLHQLRIAETEKYAHVTFFFNGGTEEPFDHESRILIPSPKVATYDLKPEMSAHELTAQLITVLNEHKTDVVICNFANPDMVGHTGNINATQKAIECIDTCLAKLWNCVEKLGGVMLITSDHGNAEVMFDAQNQQPQTAHTTNLVPLLLLNHDWTFRQEYGSLTDIAPTILTLLGITPPQEMTGHVLVQKKSI